MVKKSKRANALRRKREERRLQKANKGRREEKGNCARQEERKSSRKMSKGAQTWHWTPRKATRREYQGAAGLRHQDGTRYEIENGRAFCTILSLLFVCLAIHFSLGYILPLLLTYLSISASSETWFHHLLRLSGAVLHQQHRNVKTLVILGLARSQRRSRRIAKSLLSGCSCLRPCLCPCPSLSFSCPSGSWHFRSPLLLGPSIAKLELSCSSRLALNRCLGRFR